MHLDDRVTLSVDKLERIVAAIRDNRRLNRENRYPRSERDLAHRLVEGAGLVKVLEQVARVAKVPRPVLLLGERGTGKELVAWEIHRRSPRAEGPFVAFNCAAVPETLIESELFGHEKGAFTGATAKKPGRFELADGGTLFLDEIADMSEAFQAKVLRALEYQRFERVAGSQSVEVDVRVVAATNADLDRRMADGKFRRDLYDRLAFEVIRIPPLRDRKRDIPELASHFLIRFADEAGTRPREVAPEAAEVLCAYDYPGNVRELRHIVERAAFRCDEPALSCEAVMAALPTTGPGEPARPASGTFADRVAQMEKDLLLGALRSNQYSQKTAADSLGLTYDQFRHMFRKYGLKDEK